MPSNYQFESIDGFDVHSLVSEDARVSVVPELGGKVVSIQHLPSGREWLDGWEPAQERRLWRPTDPEDFETSSGSGIDECLPSVLACEYKEHPIPDHGELWSARAEFDELAAPAGHLTCQWALSSLPLKFERQITLESGTLRFRYTLQNLSDQPTPFLWAWHPLFALHPGDKMTTTPALKTCMTADGERHPWPVFQPGQDLSRARTGSPHPSCAKVFLGPSERQKFLIQGETGALELEWDMKQLPWTGIWITRGAWKGLHHWAIEPTNAPVDYLSEVEPEDPHSHLTPFEVRNWSILLNLRDSH